MTEKVQTKVYLPPDVKAMLDADKRSNSDVVEAALVNEYGGEKKAALQRRVEEKERRISNLKTERNERTREIEEVREELEGLKKRLKKSEEVEENMLEEAVEAIGPTPEHETRKVKWWADKIGMDENELQQRIKEAYEP